MKYSIATLISALALVRAIPDGIPSESTARSLLSELTVFESSDDGSYDRDLFPTWDTIEGTCNAREYVLRRDGDGVEVGSDCYPTAGTWTCPYDGTTHSIPSEVSIDHMVPLKNAWISGASEWTTADREAFANDVKGVQLWAVTGTTNSKKSDKSPDEWQPPKTEIHCQYAAAWIQVKSTYKLTVTAAEQSSLEEMLGSC